MVVNQAIEVLKDLLLALLAMAVVGWGSAFALRWYGQRWTWPLLAVPVAGIVFGGSTRYAVALGAVYALVVGWHWHREDLAVGADIAERARNRTGPVILLKAWLERRAVEKEGWINSHGLVVGFDGRRLPVRIPVGYESGTHTLVVGATGSGKTVTQGWIAARLVERSHGAVVVDPKGDDHLADVLEAAAGRAGRRFRCWSPDGAVPYNPYGFGSPSEVVDKALSGEEWSEPHYLRQAQRYLGHAVSTMQAAGVVVSPVSLVEHMDPGLLELTARKLPERQADAVQGYLDKLTDRQRRELTGVRDRLAVLAESDVARWLHPIAGNPSLQLLESVKRRDVVLFRLDADRRPLVSQMLAAAVVSDLVSVVGGLQGHPVPTLVVVDEFSAVAPTQVARLFARSRSAGISLVLGSQELADLEMAGLREQVLGNVGCVIAHRQNVPGSAELVAEIAGTRPVWVATQQTADRAGRLSERGSRTRGHEFWIHPSTIKGLGVGRAVVVSPGTGRRPVVARICRAGR